MPETELYAHLAEIAGVFVGFGTLIVLRSVRPTDWHELVPLRVLVSMGMLTVVAALAPLTAARFDLSEHQVWRVSSVVLLVGWAIFFVAHSRTSEYRTYWGSAATLHWRWTDIVEYLGTALYMVALFAGMIVIALGVAPDLDAGLYCAIVVLMLFGCGWSLLTLVFTQQAPDRHAQQHAATKGHHQTHPTLTHQDATSSTASPRPDAVMDPSDARH